MYYLMISISALLFSLQFMFNNGFQKENGNTLCSSLKFSLYTSITGFVILLFINHFQLNCSLFSVIIAVIYSLVTLLLNYSSVMVFSHANLAAYSIFAMIGGMVLPFFYGLLRGEEAKLSRILCCALITVAALMTISENKHTKDTVKYYIAVFFLNGLIVILSSLHQSFTNLCVDSSSFLMLTKLIITLLCTVLLLFQKGPRFGITCISALLCTGYSAFNSLGNLLLLIALLHLPTSVQYPIVTGGTIVFSTCIDLLRKVPVSHKEILAAVVALVCSIVMAF